MKKNRVLKYFHINLAGNTLKANVKIKKWFTITIPCAIHPYFESTLNQSRDVCFGEDCIYAHDIYAVDEIINRLIELDAGHLLVNLKE